MTPIYINGDMKMIEKDKWEWFGNAGHLIVSNRCRFHLTTKVGPWLISTVGEFVPHRDSKEFDTVGLDRLYETMVFVTKGECDCGCGLPEHDHDYMELEMKGYSTPKDANIGHLELCEKWAKIDYENGTKGMKL